MGLSGKKIVKANINFNGDALYGLLRYKLHALLKVAPEYLKSCELEAGEWGSVGSIINWTTFLDGKNQALKHNIESLDENNKLMVLKIIDGDLLKVYKSLKAHVQVEGNGVNSSIVTWTLDYEKMNEDVPDPDSLAEFAKNIFKFVETRADSLVDMKIPQPQ